MIVYVYIIYNVYIHTHTYIHTLHYITFTLHYIALHYITYIHTYIFSTVSRLLISHLWYWNRFKTSPHHSMSMMRGLLAMGFSAGPQRSRSVPVLRKICVRVLRKKLGFKSSFRNRRRGFKGFIFSVLWLGGDLMCGCVCREVERCGCGYQVNYIQPWYIVVPGPL